VLSCFFFLFLFFVFFWSLFLDFLFIFVFSWFTCNSLGLLCCVVFCFSFFFLFFFFIFFFGFFSFLSEVPGEEKKKQVVPWRPAESICLCLPVGGVDGAGTQNFTPHTSSVPPPCRLFCYCFPPGARTITPFLQKIYNI